MHFLYIFVGGRVWKHNLILHYLYYVICYKINVNVLLLVVKTIIIQSSFNSN